MQNLRFNQLVSLCSCLKLTSPSKNMESNNMTKETIHIFIFIFLYDDKRGKPVESSRTDKRPLAEFFASFYPSRPILSSCNLPTGYSCRLWYLFMLRASVVLCSDRMHSSVFPNLLALLFFAILVNAGNFFFLLNLNHKSPAW